MHGLLSQQVSSCKSVFGWFYCFDFHSFYVITSAMEVMIWPVLKCRLLNNNNRAFSYQATLLWNQMPVSVHGADTVSTFKSSADLGLDDGLFNVAQEWMLPTSSM